MERVQKLARQVLGEELLNLKDPRIGFATVTTVRVSADLRHARVFVSVMGSVTEKEETMVALRKAAPHLRRELGRQVRLKYSPELKFELDEGPEVAERMEEIFKQLHGDEDEDGPNDES
jgi:ribosome-binding factor A